MKAILVIHTTALDFNVVVSLDADTGNRRNRRDSSKHCDQEDQQREWRDHGVLVSKCDYFCDCCRRSGYLDRFGLILEERREDFVNV